MGSAAKSNSAESVDAGFRLNAGEVVLDLANCLTHYGLICYAMRVVAHVTTISGLTCGF